MFDTSDLDLLISLLKDGCFLKDKFKRDSLNKRGFVNLDYMKSFIDMLKTFRDKVRWTSRYI